MSKKIKKFIFSFLITIYSVTLISYWFVDNDYFTKIIAKEGFFGLFLIFNISFPFWIGFIFSILILLYSIFQQKKFYISSKKSYFFLSIVAYLYIFILYALSIYLRLLLPDLEPAYSGENFISQMSNFFTISISQIIWITLFSIIVYLLGELTTKSFFKKQNLILYSKSTNILLNFILGFISLTLISFILASISFFNALSISILFFVIAFLQRELIIEILKSFFKKRTLSFSTKKMSTWIIFLLIIFFSIFFINSLLPSPQGFDSGTEYLNRAKLIAKHGQLMPGTYPYTYSLIMAIGYFFSGNVMYSFGINLILSILGLITLFQTIKLVTKDKTISLLIATLWISLPLTMSYLHYEAKVELFLFFTSSICILLFIYFLRNPKQYHIIYLISLFLGFAFTIKITTLFLILALFIPISYIVIKSNSIKKTISIMSFAFIFGISTVLPWIAHSVYTTVQSGEPITYLSLVKSVNVVNKKTFNAFDTSDCVTTTKEDDYIRFKINYPNPFLKLFIAPWDLMRNSTSFVNRSLINIGYVPTLFYYIFLLYFIYFILKKKTENKELNILIFSTIIFWLLWGFLAKDIIWYGYAGFILYFILIGVVLKHIKNTNSLVYSFFILLIFINIIFHSLAISKKFLPVRQIGYISFGTYLKMNEDIVNIVNSPENVDKKIYMQNMTALYDIENNHKRVFRDHMLSQYLCIMQKNNNNFDSMLNHLQENDITYVISFNSNVIKNSSERKAIYKKLLSFEKFTKEKLKLIEKNEIISLYQVPKK